MNFEGATNMRPRLPLIMGPITVTEAPMEENLEMGSVMYVLTILGLEVLLSLSKEITH